MSPQAAWQQKCCIKHTNLASFSCVCVCVREHTVEILIKKSASDLIEFFFTASAHPEALKNKTKPVHLPLSSSSSSIRHHCSEHMPDTLCGRSDRVMFYCQEPRQTYKQPDLSLGIEFLIVHYKLFSLKNICPSPNVYWRRANGVRLVTWIRMLPSKFGRSHRVRPGAGPGQGARDRYPACQTRARTSAATIINWLWGCKRAGT